MNKRHGAVAVFLIVCILALMLGSIPGVEGDLTSDLNAAQKKLDALKSQLQQIQKGLLGAFSMNPATNYQYDPKTKTIFELIPSAAAVTNPPPPGATTVAPAGFDRRLHLQLTTDPQVQQFVRLTAGKQLVLDEMKIFSTVIQEKQVELNAVVKLLSEKFSISKDRNYEYEPTTMRLCEVGAPPPAKTSGSGSSAIQLRAVLPPQVSASTIEDAQKPVPLRK